jgi:acetyl esterase/lipase
MVLLKKKGMSTAPEAVGDVDNRRIDGPAGPIPVRIYTPRLSGPFPVRVYFRGGGWVTADLDTYDASACALTNAANAIVVSSHYRQVPEHQFPDLRGMASTSVVTAEVDPLRSESKTYADALRKASVDIKLHELQGVTPEFFGMGAVVLETKTAVQRAAADPKGGSTAADVRTTGKSPR